MNGGTMFKAHDGSHGVLRKSDKGGSTSVGDQVASLVLLSGGESPDGRAADDHHSFASEVRALLDRTMVHWTLAYLAGAWLVLQLMDVLTDIWGWSLGAQRAVCLALALGLMPALVIAWFHGERGRQEVTAMEVLLVGALLFVSGLVIWVVCAA